MAVILKLESLINGAVLAVRRMWNKKVCQMPAFLMLTIPAMYQFFKPAV